jgi:NAD(P)-dependent dehydrogenase (short-subunit alcohol dehydrogenase family)
VATLPRPSDLLDLDGVVVVVTGAGGSIGHGIARRFAGAGASVVLHHRSSAAAVQRLADELPTPAAAVQTDLATPEGPERLLEAAEAALGPVDVLVNNAGAQPLSPLAEVDEAEWREVLEVNVTAVHRCTQAFARRRRVHGGGGAVVHVASIEGHQPAVAHGHYATSKAAVRMHARAAAMEFGPDGIRVNVVSPGLVHRDGIEQDWPEGVRRWRAAAPLERLGTPEDIGDACLFLASPLARWVTGAELVVDGGVLTRSTW